MPPWSTNSDYCTLVLSTGNQGQYSLRGITDTGSLGWTSDNAFCMPMVGGGWQVVLYLALAFWGFLTVINLIDMFDLRRLGTGGTVAETVKTLARQIATLVAVCTSFFLLLLAHQALYLLVNALVGGDLTPGRVDALWDNRHALGVLRSTRQAFDPAGLPILGWIGSHLQAIFDNNLPGDNTVGSFTWAAVRSALDEVDTIMVQGVGPIRFVAESMLVISAPVAWMAAGSRHTREAFIRWLREYSYLEGMALFTAVGLAAFSHIVCDPAHCTKTRDSFGMGESQYAFMLLAFTALTSGPMLAYMWRIVGAVLDFGVKAFDTRYSRIRGGFNLALDATKLLGDVVQSYSSMLPNSASPGSIGQMLSKGGEVFSNVGETGRTLSNIIPGAPFTASSNLPRAGDRGWLENPDTKNQLGGGGGNQPPGPQGPGIPPAGGNQPAPPVQVNTPPPAAPVVNQPAPQVRVITPAPPVGPQGPSGQPGPAGSPALMGPPSSGPALMGPPSSGPALMGPPSSGPALMAPPAATWEVGGAAAVPPVIP